MLVIFLVTPGLRKTCNLQNVHMCCVLNYWLSCMKCLAGKEKPVETYYGHLLPGNTQIMQIFLDYQQLWTSWEELQWPREKKKES